jgi:hypothetical protein
VATELRPAPMAGVYFPPCCRSRCRSRSRCQCCRCRWNDMPGGYVQKIAGPVNTPSSTQFDHAIRVRDSVSPIPVLLDAQYRLRLDGCLGE